MNKHNSIIIKEIELENGKLGWRRDIKLHDIEVNEVISLLNILHKISGDVWKLVSTYTELERKEGDKYLS